MSNNDKLHNFTLWEPITCKSPSEPHFIQTHAHVSNMHSCESLQIWSWNDSITHFPLLKIVVSSVCCRPAAVGATLATASAVILIFANLMTEVSDASSAPRNAPTFTSFSLAFSTMLFAYGGTSAFPTIQADMKKPQKFPKAVLIAYIGKYIHLTHLGLGVFFICWWSEGLMWKKYRDPSNTPRGTWYWFSYFPFD